MFMFDFIGAIVCCLLDASVRAFVWFMFPITCFMFLVHGYIRSAGSREAESIEILFPVRLMFGFLLLMTTYTDLDSESMRIVAVMADETR